MIVRRYEVGDRDAVRDIHAEAFGRDVEAVLFDALMDDGDAIEPLSFVVEVDGRPVGHVVCSRATVGNHGVAALGPIGVLRARQGKGVGSAMVHAVLGAADELELPLVALLGSRAYYGRFGFVPGSELAIEAPEPVWGDDFQVRRLRAYSADVRGQFRYAPAFALVS